MLRASSRSNKLARMTQSPFALGVSVSYPAMTNFGGLGIMPTMFAWYQVFGVAQKNPSLLIAPDVVNQKMMRSDTGGDTSARRSPGLTALVTDGGRLLFNVGIFPQVSAVSFSPDDPNLVAVGTRQNGIFMSGDGGLTWEKVPGSVATLITSLTWRSSTDLTVSTYGRGLWRLKWEWNSAHTRPRQALRKAVRYPGPSSGMGIRSTL